MRAAKAAGLAPSDLSEIEAATKKQMDLSALDFSGMTQWDQVLTYALGAWIAQVDGVVSTSEFDMLGELGKKMGLPEALQKRATAVANDIACLPEGGKPEKYDFEKLIVRLKERMPQLAK
jgi:hypothetical protein